AGPVARLDHAHRRQRTQPRPHARATDADLLGELPLGRQPATRPEVPTLDELAHVAHHQLGRQTLERFFGWRRLTRGHTNRSCASMLRREGRNVSPPRHPVNDVAYGADTLRPAGAAGVWRAQPVTTHMNSTDWYHLFSAIH